MATATHLRQTRRGTVLNSYSAPQEDALDRAVLAVRRHLESERLEVLQFHRRLALTHVMRRMQRHDPTLACEVGSARSAIKPDGGILALVDQDGTPYPILIAEAKHQGTNDQRALDGLPPQAQGNAIERLGKNLTVIRDCFLGEQILPFICFGDGCDFAPGSPILDRVRSIARFAPLNTIRVHGEGRDGSVLRGSFFFRDAPWTEPEMVTAMLTVARASLAYYEARYGAIFERRLL